MPSRQLSALVALILVVVGSLRIISTYHVLSHTFDEPAHLAGGMEWLEAHRYTYRDLHPPLARVVGALGLHFAGIHWIDGRDEYQEGLHLVGNGEQYQRALFSGRLAMLPFFWLAAAIVYAWSLRLGGTLAAILATAFFTALPPVLGHAGLVTNDMALTACMGLALLLSISWSQKPDWRRTIWFGASLGLAVLAKFSALVFLPCSWLAMYGASLLSGAPRSAAIRAEIKRCVLPALGALAVGFLVIWAGYRFTYGKVDYLHNKLPAPMFFLELGDLFNHNETEHLSYLFGKLSLTGFWYYYPAVLSIKTPIAMLILVLGAVLAAFRRGDPWKLRQPLSMSAGVLLFAMLFIKGNIGVRHVLPVYLAFSVAAGVVSCHVLKMSRPRWTGVVMVAWLLGWFVLSGAFQHPEYTAYTNEFAGGNPENFVADSDLDWGQDMGILAAKLQSYHAQQVWTNCDEGYVLTGNPFPPSRSIPKEPEPPAGWSAVCATPWKVDGYPSWADKVPPRERVGRSILLYYKPPVTRQP